MDDHCYIVMADHVTAIDGLVVFPCMQRKTLY